MRRDGPPPPWSAALPRLPGGLQDVLDMPPEVPFVRLGPALARIGVRGLSAEQFRPFPSEQSRIEEEVEAELGWPGR